MFATMLCAVSWWASALGILFVAVCLILIALVLLQKGRGGGLAAAFGGEGGQSAFGSKTGDVFTWVTIVIVVAFFLIAISLSLGYKPASLDEDIQQGAGIKSNDTSMPVDAEAPKPEADAGDKAGAAAADAEETASDSAVTAEEGAEKADTSDVPVPEETPKEAETTTTE